MPYHVVLKSMLIESEINMEPSLLQTFNGTETRKGCLETRKRHKQV